MIKAQQTEQKDPLTDIESNKRKRAATVKKAQQAEQEEPLTDTQPKKRKRATTVRKAQRQKKEGKIIGVGAKHNTIAGKPVGSCVTDVTVVRSAAQGTTAPTVPMPNSDTLLSQICKQQGQIVSLLTALVQTYVPLQQPSSLPPPALQQPSSLPAPTLQQLSSLPAPALQQPSSLPAPTLQQPSSLPAALPRERTPQDMSECVICMAIVNSGQFEFPEDTKLVSAVLCIYSSHKFTKRVTLEMQHCALIDNREDASKLCFVGANISQPALPYRFEFLDHHEAMFSEHSACGSVQLNHFSMIGVVQRAGQAKRYRAHLLYTDVAAISRKIFFTITKDTQAHIMAAYKTLGAVEGQYDSVDQPVVFTGSEIRLDLRPDGAECEGWKITPLTHPGILRTHVDCFGIGQRAPNCRLLTNWTKDTPASTTTYNVPLIGAKEPFNFFNITLSPPSTIGGVVTEVSAPLSPLSVSGAVAASASAPQSAAVCKKISELDMKNAISSVVNWFRLGEQLGMNFETLEKILRDFDRFGTSIQQSKLVNSWLKSDPEASWSKLCGALERIEENTVAQGIRERHL